MKGNTNTKTPTVYALLMYSLVLFAVVMLPNLHHAQICDLLEEVEDCSVDGYCAPLSYLGDGYCDGPFAFSAWHAYYLSC